MTVDSDCACRLMTDSAFPPRRTFTIALPHRGALHLGDRCLVMGILNVTPDSFAETTSKLDPARALDAALRMEAAGADMIDVGGESTRPGAEPVGAEVEAARVLPVLRALAGRLRIPVSVDTSKADVAVAGLNVNLEAQVGFVGKGGANAEMSSSGQTVVKGTMVMIN